MPRGATLRRQYVLCGKPHCVRRHGPYWYAFWKEGGRTRSAYVGSDARLAELLRAWGERPPQPDVDEDDDDGGDWLPEVTMVPARGRRSRGRR